MKKFLGIVLLIALCCATVFAVDFSAQVKIHMSFGDEGFSITNFKGLWEPTFSFSISDGVAGASMKIAPVDFGRTFGIHTDIWYKPDVDIRADKENVSFVWEDSWKFTLGTESYVSFNGISNITGFAGVNYGIGSDSYDLALGYKPSINNTDTNAFFVASQVNHTLPNGAVHLDALARIDVEAKKARVNYFLGEADWIIGDPNFRIQKKGIASWFCGDEAFYFNRRDYSWSAEIAKGTDNQSKYVAGVRYKYYADSEEKTGLYAYGLMHYYTGNASDLYVEAEVEAGKSGAVLEFSTSATKDGNSGIGYLRSAFNYGGTKANVRLEEVYANMTKKNDENTPYAVVRYLNKNAYSGISSDVGFYLTAGLQNSVGICSLDTSLRLGLGENFKFKWRPAVDATVNF